MVDTLVVDALVVGALVDGTLVGAPVGALTDTKPWPPEDAGVTMR